MTHPTALGEDELLKQCVWTRTRGSGPGGQRRNKVETGATLLHEPTGLSAQATERRSQNENRRVALKRLRLVLATEHRATVPVPKGLDEIASPLWRERRQGNKIVCNPRHRDFPTLLAEALDVIADSGWKPKKAALRLGVTMSQLLKLAREHPAALAKLNAEREKRRLSSLS